MEKDTLKQQASHLKEQGFSYRKIAKILGVGKTTIHEWLTKTAKISIEIPVSDDILNSTDSVVGYINNNLSRVITKKNTSSEIQDFLESLAPINVSYVPFNPSNSTVNAKSHKHYAVVVGDMHFPLHDQVTLDIFLETVFQLKPDTIVLNGDTVDLLSISRYSKDIRKNHSLSDERIAYHKFLDDLLSVSKPTAKIFETNANHSGNDLYGRWYRYLSDRIPELTCLSDIHDKLSYQNIFLGNYQSRVELVDYVELNKNFVVLHGDIVRSKGGASANGHLDKWLTNVMHNHTHRFGSTAKRVPAIGSQKEKQLYAWENSCACSLSPLYGSAPNWQNGFSIISIDDENFGVEQVMVNGKSANVSTLGKTIYAS